MRSSAEVDDVLLDGRVRAGLEGLRVEGVDGEEGRVVVTVDPGLRVGLVALDRPEIALTETRETSAMGLGARWVRSTHELSPKSFQVSCSTKSYLERDSTSSSQRLANRKPSERYSPEEEERGRLNQRRTLASATAARGLTVLVPCRLPVVSVEEGRDRRGIGLGAAERREIRRVGRRVDLLVGHGPG